jgi:hypothetical protein
LCGENAWIGVGRVRTGVIEGPRAKLKHLHGGVDIGVGRDQPVDYRSVPVRSSDEERGKPVLGSKGQADARGEQESKQQGNNDFMSIMFYQLISKHKFLCKKIDIFFRPAKFLA